MLFWIVIAVLTFAAALALMLPLMRAGVTVSTGDEGEAAVYRDQLQELERDKALGLISDQDSSYARAEIGRRLLAASAAPTGLSETPVAQRSHPLAQLFIVLCLPAIGLGLYLMTGSPGVPAQPLAARLENPGGNLDLLVAKAERHLAANPDDGSGWDVLAPIYFKSERLGDAELAYRNAIRLNGASAERLSGLGETMIASTDGIVTEDARLAFAAVLKLEADNPRAAFYLALADEQAGKRAEALAAFQALAERSPPGAPWLDLVKAHIIANGGEMAVAEATPVDPRGPVNPDAPGNPSAADVAAAVGMPTEDRAAMIRTMVDSLDQKLKEDPNNFEGWMRLVRSYAMLNEPDRAVSALKAGLVTFPAEGEQGRTLIASARELGLPVEEALK